MLAPTPPYGGEALTVGSYRLSKLCSKRRKKSKRLELTFPTELTSPPTGCGKEEPAVGDSLTISSLRTIEGG